MKILDNDQMITAKIPCLIETPEHFVINGHVYDKSTLQPIPLRMCIAGNYDTIYPFLYRHIRNYSSAVDTKDSSNTGYPYASSFDEDYKNIYIDETDNSKVYQAGLVTNNIGSSFLSYTETEQDVTDLTRISYNSGQASNGPNRGYCSDCKILYSNKDYILIFWRAPGYYVNCRDITMYLYNKNTKALSKFKVLSENGNNHSDIHVQITKVVNDDIIYMLTRSYDSISLVKAVLSTGTWTTLQTVAQTKQTFGLTCNFTELKDGHFADQNVFISVGIGNNQLPTYGGQYKVCFDRTTINYSTETFTYEYIPINDIDSVAAEIVRSPYGSFSDICSKLYWQLYSFSENDNDYVVIVNHCGANNPNYYPDDHKIMVFKYDIENDSYQLCSSIPFNYNCRDVIKYYQGNPRILLTLHNDRYHIFAFDSSTESYNIIQTVAGSFEVIGFDMSNKLYTIDNNNNINVISPQNVATVEADFSEDLYQKDNGDIETSVKFYAKNIFNQYIKTNVRLSLFGNVEFENGEKVATYETLNNGIKTIPVTITGVGKIEVYITNI